MSLGKKNNTGNEAVPRIEKKNMNELEEQQIHVVAEYEYDDYTIRRLLGAFWIREEAEAFKAEQDNQRHHEILPVFLKGTRK